MSLFQKNKISIKKETQEDRTNIFVDYHKLKQPKEFVSVMIHELIGVNRCLVVIDTSFAYINAGLDIEKEIKILTKLLDDQSISYRRLITKSDSNATVLGVPIKLSSKKKVLNYLIGFVITTDDFDKLETMSDKFNVFYYSILPDTDTEVLLDKFYSDHGEMDELKEMCDLNIYNDNFFSRMRIDQQTNKINPIEQVLQKYV
jgi:hypothetical protein